MNLLPLKPAKTPSASAAAPALSPLPLPPPVSWRESPVSLPSSPGVYWFLDGSNNVLYVGKAKNLKNRLVSYARTNHLLPKTRQLLRAASAVKYEMLESELEALLVEAELIRLHQPYYNILLKDDKSPLYIVTTKEPYPRVLAVRKSDLNAHTYTIRREFGPFPSAKQVREVLKIARRLFPYCTASDSDKKHHKACFYRHLGLCPGACTGEISTERYLQLIKDLELFLRGKHRDVVKELTKEIDTAVRVLDFESADILKHKIASVEYIVSHYRLQVGDQPLPDLTENHTSQRLVALKRLLHQKGLKLSELSRIEAYDVANLQGQSAAVSMVVVTDGEPDHSAYRHFSIKSMTTPNDVGMLKEAIVRRQRHPEWGTPDLIVIDGGRPQLKAVLSIIKWQVPVVSLAKHPDRLMVVHKGEKLSYASVKLLPGTPAANLLIGLRDEAHRFSRRLHHHRAEKKLLNTE